MTWLDSSLEGSNRDIQSLCPPFRNLELHPARAFLFHNDFSLCPVPQFESDAGSLEDAPVLDD
jgi:hypothetical protein